MWHGLVRSHRQLATRHRLLIAYCAWATLASMRTRKRVAERGCSWSVMMPPDGRTRETGMQKVPSNEDLGDITRHDATNATNATHEKIPGAGPGQDDLVVLQA